MLNTGIYSGHFHLSPHWAYTVYFMIFFAVGVKILYVFSAVSLSLFTRSLFSLGGDFRGRAVFALAQQWPSPSPCTGLHFNRFLMQKKKEMQPVEVMGTGCHLSYCLVGRWQLKSTAMLNDLLGIRMPLQPLIWAAGRSFFSHSVHGTSASLFQLLNDGFTSEIQLS